MTLLRPVLGAVGAILLGAAPAFAQCAMCKEALESGGESAAGFSKGVALGVFLLLGTFFGIAGGFVFLIVRSGRTRPPA